MIRKQAENILEILTDLTAVLESFKGSKAEQAKTILNEAVSKLTDMLTEIVNDDEYGMYIEDLQRRIQLTAPWLFNQYIDPEDLWGIPESD